MVPCFTSVENSKCLDRRKHKERVKQRSKTRTIRPLEAKRIFRNFHGCVQRCKHPRGCEQQNCGLGEPDRNLYQDPSSLEKRNSKVCAAKLRLWRAGENSISKSGFSLKHTIEKYFQSLRTLKTQASADISPLWVQNQTSETHLQKNDRCKLQ